METKANKKVLHLVLKRKWYDMIASGEKTEEYRAFTKYWIHRIVNADALREIGINNLADFLCKYEIGKDLQHSDISRHFTHVTFHLGYSNENVMTFRIESISIGQGKVEWGAPADHRYLFVIKLGGREE